MAVMKCKMCGGELLLTPGESVAQCDSCGTMQTVPNADNEKKMALFARANRLRANCDFDSAAGVYESIVRDYPEEAESYWGLVLCKYGIEYVDDPATGKKIPTCHRSSFDSVLEDGNFIQTMENADPVALRVYREEAKQIEKLREGILAVSASEEPYDVFICYKETDHLGQRTLDSVLAQDIYTALTDKGYRVFFSRITLQRVLGQAYEPYIFAALNSAKVMLAIGTKFEYYNAVWVKNEWGRFLKLMEEDKSKHLIPCFRDIDAYDMPREFKPLQGVNLAQMGAVQDIVFNMEKYIPLNKPTPAAVPVTLGGGGDNKVASLLDRGNMALEDGEWEKADSFFEDVLNNDSKNAAAYLGKALAQEKCRTLDTLVRKRKALVPAGVPRKMEISRDDAHAREMAEQYSIPGYYPPQRIMACYSGQSWFYKSDVFHWEKRLQQEKDYWINNKLLSRAEQFATGDLARTLQGEKQGLLDHFLAYLNNAQEEEKKNQEEVSGNYRAFLADADAKVKADGEKWRQKRDEDYENWVKAAESAGDVKVLREAAAGFDKLGDYRDSRQWADKCRLRIQAAVEEANRQAEEKRRIAEEEARRQAEKEAAIQEAKARKVKRQKTVIAAVSVAVILALLLTFLVVIPGSKYSAAEALVQQGDLAHAAMAFARLGSFRDARERSFALWDQIAHRESMAIAYSYALAITQSGDVLSTSALKDTGDWHNIVDISANTTGALGLRADGTVVGIGVNIWNNDELSDYVSDWKDIVDIAVGEYYVVGLKMDGTVIAEGTPYYNGCDVEDWTDIIAIDTGSSGHTVGLRADGTVVAVGNNLTDACFVGEWEDIVAISAGTGYTLGLKADGTVMAKGSLSNPDCNVELWTDIVAICAGEYSLGLKSDGTVVAAGNGEKGCQNVEQLRGIREIYTGYDLTVVRDSSGKVLVVGTNDAFELPDKISEFKDIIIPKD